MLHVNQLIGFGAGGGVPISVGSTATSTGSGTSTTVTLPSGIQAGDLLIVVIWGNNNWPATFPAGWTKLNEAGLGVGVVAYRRADGSEGASIAVTRGGNVDTVAVALRLVNVPAGRVPAISTVASATSSAPDSGSVASVYNYYLSCVTATSGTTAINSVPANYTSAVSLSNAGGLAAIAVAQRAASPEDPGAWALAASQTWNAWTIGI